MAKKTKKTKSQPQVVDVAKLPQQDQKTFAEIKNLADGVVRAAKDKTDPALEIPARTLSNVHYNKKKRFIEMGSDTNQRQLFNLSQAKSYMQTMLVASGCQNAHRPAARRPACGVMYYLLKHSIEGTKEETFDDQDESRHVIEDLEVDAQRPARGAARLRQERRRDGRRNYPDRQRRRRSIAPAWAPAATASPRSSSRR